MRWWLHSRGRANGAAGDGTLTTESPGNEPPDVFVYDPAQPVPSAGGHSCCDPGYAPMGPADQVAVEVLHGVLVYTSAPLAQPMVVAGRDQPRRSMMVALAMPAPSHIVWRP